MTQDTINICRAVAALSDKLASDKIELAACKRKIEKLTKSISDNEIALRSFNNKLDFNGVHKSIYEDPEMEEECKEESTKS